MLMANFTPMLTKLIFPNRNHSAVPSTFRLPEDDPELVRRLIDYAYTGKYTDSAEKKNNGCFFVSGDFWSSLTALYSLRG